MTYMQANRSHAIWHFVFEDKAKVFLAKNLVFSGVIFPLLR